MLMKTLLKYLFPISIISICFLFSGCSEKITGPTDQRSIGKIAFSSDRDDGNGEIYVMNPSGSRQIRLTHNSAYDSWPSWSPDRKKIAFMSNRDGNEEIYIMNANGSNEVNLTNNPAIDSHPCWSR